jgi:hypothetical protein
MSWSASAKDSAVVGAAAGSAGAYPPAALPATGILRIAAIYGFAAARAYITIKVSPAVAADHYSWFASLWYDMN